jgi:hypothetical protein
MRATSTGVGGVRTTRGGRGIETYVGAAKIDVRVKGVCLNTAGLEGFGVGGRGEDAEVHAVHTWDGYTNGKRGVLDIRHVDGCLAEYSEHDNTDQNMMMIGGKDSRVSRCHSGQTRPDQTLLYLRLNWQMVVSTGFASYLLTRASRLQTLLQHA